MGDVRLTFAGTLEIPGEIVYVHPLHNLAVIHYDPKLIGTTPVRAAKLDTEPLKRRRERQCGRHGRQRRDQVAHHHDRRRRVRCSCRCRARCSFARAICEVASLVNAPDDFVGVLSDDAGRVRGLWASFASDNGRELVQENRGMSSDLVAETLDIVRDQPPLHSLEAEFVPQTLAECAPAAV